MKSLKFFSGFPVHSNEIPTSHQLRRLRTVGLWLAVLSLSRAALRVSCAQPPGLLASTSPERGPLYSLHTCCFVPWAAALPNQFLCTTASFSCQVGLTPLTCIKVNLLFRIFLKNCPYLFSGSFPSPAFSPLSTRHANHNVSINIS